jgi:hypothetical protein
MKIGTKKEKKKRKKRRSKLVDYDYQSINKKIGGVSNIIVLIPKISPLNAIKVIFYFFIS